MLKLVGWAVGIVPFSAGRGYQLGRRASGKYEDDDGDSAAANYQERYELSQRTKHRTLLLIDCKTQHGRMLTIAPRTSEYVLVRFATVPTGSPRATLER
jgi:hypothetical protein